jgi:hypothetical protein
MIRTRWFDHMQRGVDQTPQIRLIAKLKLAKCTCAPRTVFRNIQRATPAGVNRYQAVAGRWRFLSFRCRDLLLPAKACISCMANRASASPIPVSALYFQVAGEEVLCAPRIGGLGENRHAMH